jgi:hypothetical protein
MKKRAKNLDGKAAGLTLTLLFLFAGTLAVTAQNIILKTTCTAGVQPGNAVAADVNGDGTLDLISANVGDNSLTVLTNNGDGTFTASETIFSVGNGPAVTAADVNHDGKQDLITANFFDNNLTVLTNDGAGNFVFNANYPVGSGPYWVVTSTNITGDGRQYVITANYKASTLSVLTNNGGGVLGFDATYNVGTGPQYVTVADVNNDGKFDLVTANYSGSLTVLTNNGSGVFGSNATYTAGINGPNNVVAADVNGDNKVDLICANSDNTLIVLTNNGSGRFILSATNFISSNVNAYPYVTAAHMNGDIKVDLISANSGDNKVLVLTNNGSGVFSTNTLYSVGNTPQYIIAADVSGDGKPDLITANYNNNNLTVLLSSGPPPPLSVQSLSATNALLSWPIYWYDYGIQQNPALVGANWTTVTNAISNTTGTNLATVPISNGNKFFRLVHP